MRTDDNTFALFLDKSLIVDFIFDLIEDEGEFHINSRVKLLNVSSNKRDSNEMTQRKHLD